MQPYTRQRWEIPTIYLPRCKVFKKLEQLRIYAICVLHFITFSFLRFRDHILSRMVRELSAARVTQEMYEENSFLRDQMLLTTLHQLLASLDEFDIVLENSITKGIGR